MTVVSAKPILSATQRNVIWGFIALLAALAFMRSLAPENTAHAVRKLIKSRGASSKAEKEELEKLRDEIHRERIALERLQNETGDSRAFLEKFEEFHKAEEERGAVAADQMVIPPPEEASDAISDKSSFVEKRQQLQDDDDANDMEQNELLEEAAEKDGITEVDEDEEEDGLVQLADDECPTIIVLESSKSGLGTQIEHLVSLLSLSFAVQNACIVLPPINSYDDENNFRPVAFGEIFDEEEFSETGVRTLPLAACKDISMSAVFDDGGAETAIVKNFAAFVSDSDPDVAKETMLVHKETSGHRFENSSVVDGDVTIMAAYISKKVGHHDERTCIGFGRMRAEVAINLDTLEHLKPASALADFLSSRYPLATETMFVKLRWDKSYCEQKRTETGTVCVVSDVILPTEEYIRSIAYTAHHMGVSFIYLSLPSHVPEDVSEDVYTNLKILEPILLDVDGDIFTANLIEHELAIQSKVFIPDGGAWSNTVQKLRNSRNHINFRDDIDSNRIVQEWKDAGWPKDSPFLIPRRKDIEFPSDTSENTSNGKQDSKVMYYGQESEEVDSITQQREANSNVQRSGGENTHLLLNQQDDSNRAVHATDTEHRPAQYEPPQDYVPNEDTDGHLFPNRGNAEAQASHFSQAQAQQLSTAEHQPLVEDPLPAEETALVEEAAPAGEAIAAEVADPAEEATSKEEAVWTERDPLGVAVEPHAHAEDASLPDYHISSKQQPHTGGQQPPEQRSEIESQTPSEQNVLLEKVALAETQQALFETASAEEPRLSDQEADLAEQANAAEQHFNTGR